MKQITSFMYTCIDRVELKSRCTPDMIRKLYRKFEEQKADKIYRMSIKCLEYLRTSKLI